MTLTLEHYRSVAPRGTLDLLERLSEPLKGKRVLHVNSTRSGGGVAEILHRLVPLMQELGLEARWETIEGNPFFYETTKKFHNGLQGNEQVISPKMLEGFLEVNRWNREKIDLSADVLFIHDPQPIALVEGRTPESRWIWRCHIDASRPQRQVWSFLRQFVLRYDAGIVSLPKFAQRLPIPQFVVFPSIDPLSDKNRDLSHDEVIKILERLKIPMDRPILLQVSRFDRFKDPVGVIEAYKLIRRRNRCILVLAGGEATDDPEGAKVLEEVRSAAGGDPDIYILLLPPTAHLEINALQRAATLVFQKSIKEGFGLTVAEAMWKKKPVIGGFTGGITAQVIYGTTGYTVNSIEGAALRASFLLNNQDVMKKMGEDAHEYVRHRFLITRHIRDYLAISQHLLPR